MKDGKQIKRTLFIRHTIEKFFYQVCIRLQRLILQCMKTTPLLRHGLCYQDHRKAAEVFAPPMIGNSYTQYLQKPLELHQVSAMRCLGVLLLQGLQHRYADKAQQNSPGEHPHLLISGIVDRSILSTTCRSCPK